MTLGSILGSIALAYFSSLFLAVSAVSCLLIGVSPLKKYAASPATYI